MEDRRLGWHMMGGIRALDGAWSIDGVLAEPGELTVSALGRTFERCRRSELSNHMAATWCPDVGVVSRYGRERSFQVWDQLIVLRRGDVTWAASPCDVMHLVSAEEKASLCEERLHPFGASPLPALVPRDRTCRWRFTVDRRAAAVTIRLAADAAAIDEWADAAPGATLVEARRTRTWIARGSAWSAAVRIRRDLCGAADGAAFAARLVALAPPRE